MVVADELPAPPPPAAPVVCPADGAGELSALNVEQADKVRTPAKAIEPTSFDDITQR